MSLVFAPVGAATLLDVSDQAMAQMSTMTNCDKLASVKSGGAAFDCGSAAACTSHCGLSLAVFALMATPAVFHALNSLDPADAVQPVLFGPHVPDPRPPRA